MSPTQIYNKLFEFYDYEGNDYDYSVFSRRIAYVTLEIKMHHSSNDIRITVANKQVYMGNIDRSPNLSPLNMLVEYEKLYGKKPINDFCNKVKRTFKEGYNLKNLLQSNLPDMVNYIERLYCGVEDNNLFNYYIEFNKLNNKVLAELHYTNLELDNSGKVIANKKLKQQCSLSTVEELQTMQNSEIFEVLIEQAAVSNDSIMRQLRPYLRKCAIDEILRTL